MVLLLTLCFLRSDFGEERNLGHSHKWQPQNLQKHPNDELCQLPRKTTYGKGVAEEITEKHNSYNVHTSQDMGVHLSLTKVKN